MAHDVRAIANEFINRSQRAGDISLTNMQLQKLPYIAHGWSLVLLQGEGLVQDKVYAWPYGPVYPDLYRNLRRYGDGKVRDPIRVYDDDLRLIAKSIRYADPTMRGEVVKATLNNEETALLDAIWEEYRKFSGIELSKLTHMPNTPWKKTRRGQQITNQCIKNFYAEKKEHSLVGA